MNDGKGPMETAPTTGTDGRSPGATTPKESAPTYRALDADRIVATIKRLSKRIEERFPESGLTQVAKELRTISLQSRERVLLAARPIPWVRVLVAVLIALIIGAVIGALVRFEWSVEVGLLDALGALEAAINDIVFVFAGIFFLWTVETRIKRGRSLKALHELRSIAHVIDMHQLTKDPERMLSSDAKDTESSPKRTMTPAELGRYLDYCSELLSLTGKLAALYVQDFDDSVVLTSVNEIESLTTGLSRKIWQKLMMVHSRHTT